MLYRTRIMSGSGKAIVLAVGKNTLFEKEKRNLESGVVKHENINIISFFSIPAKTGL